jgi:hypothetical protein
MITSRAFWISLIVGVGLAVALSACATKTAPPAVAAQCYWLSNEGAGWVARPDLAEAELCFEMDSCSGGVGISGGGCYKWAKGADAPAAPWTELGMTPLSRDEPDAAAAPTPACFMKGEHDTNWRPVSELREAQCFERDFCTGGLRQAASGDVGKPCHKWAMSAEAPALPWSATLTNPQLAADVPPPREIYEASFEQTSDSCSGPDCNLGSVRLAAATRIRERYEPNARIVARIPAGECVLIETASLLELRRRGVVLETFGAFTAGDVIYQLAYEGEGYVSVWRRGATLSVGYDETPVVRWDALPETEDSRIGWWLKLNRSNGQSGWSKQSDADKEKCDFVRR